MLNLILYLIIGTGCYLVITIDLYMLVCMKNFDVDDFVEFILDKTPETDSWAFFIARYLWVTVIWPVNVFYSMYRAMRLMSMYEEHLKEES